MFCFVTALQGTLKMLTNPTQKSSAFIPWNLRGSQLVCLSYSVHIQICYTRNPGFVVEQKFNLPKLHSLASPQGGGSCPPTGSGLDPAIGANPMRSVNTVGVGDEYGKD